MASATGGDKHIVLLFGLDADVAAGVKPVVQFVYGTVRNGNEPLFVAFAGDADIPLFVLEEQVGKAQIADFAHPQSATVKQFYHAVVALSFGQRQVDGGQNALHLIEREHLRQVSRQTWTFEQFGRVLRHMAVELQKAVERAHPAQHTRHRARRCPDFGQPRGVAVQVGEGDGQHFQSFFGHIFQEAHHIALIGRTGIFGQSLFEEQINLIFF